MAHEHLFVRVAAAQAQTARQSRLQRQSAQVLPAASGAVDNGRELLDNFDSCSLFGERGVLRNASAVDSIDLLPAAGNSAEDSLPQVSDDDNNGDDDDDDDDDELASKLWTPLGASIGCGMDDLDHDFLWQ